MPTPAPSPCPPGWLGLLGVYGAGEGTLLILERDGALEGMAKGGRFYILQVLGPDRFRFPNAGRLASRNVAFNRDASGKASGAPGPRNLRAPVRPGLPSAEEPTS